MIARISLPWLATCLAIMFFSTASLAQEKIIFDTDFGADADDLGALAMLHAYHEWEQCQLLGIMLWSTEQYVVPAVDAVNRYYGHPDIPIGLRAGETHYTHWNHNKVIADALPHELENTDVLEATTLYRQLLAEAADSSIVLVTVGPLANIKNLLESEPDDYSPLNGKELFHQKIKKMVVMGGKYPKGENEWNFWGDMPGVTQWVFNQIKLPVIFTGYEVGIAIRTGKVFRALNKRSPLYLGYRHFSAFAPWMKEYYEGQILDNSTYDQTAVLYAVEGGEGNYWKRITGGRNSIENNGNNRWVPGEPTNQSYLKLQMPAEKLAVYIEAVMMHQLPVTGQHLQVAPQGPWLQTNKGKPFLWLGDTAWELFHRLNREEAIEYLDTRAAQGFTLTQAVVLAEQGGLQVPNPYGHLPLQNNDPTQPNEKYFQHIDFIVQEAAKRGLFIGMLPTWGDKVTPKHGGGPVIFNPTNAFAYGRFLGERYKNDPIVWILGGDRNINSPAEAQVWAAMARGLRQGDDGRHLITYHPRGGSHTYNMLADTTWLDIHAFQSGHSRRYETVYKTADYLRQHSPKPFLDLEPAYETIPVRFWNYCQWELPTVVPEEVLTEAGTIKQKSYFADGYFTAHDIRVVAYWNLLSGACGHTYGHNAVWQMYHAGGPVAIPTFTDWQAALTDAGAGDIRHMRTLFTEYPLHKLTPAQGLIAGQNPADSTHIRAAQATDGTFALIYLAVGQPVTLQVDALANRVATRWYHPGNGTFTEGEVLKNKSQQKFHPPKGGRDWVLIVEKTTQQQPAQK